MKKALLFLLLLPLVAATDDWIYSSQEAVIDIEIRDTARLISLSDESYVEFVKAYLDFYPRDDGRQSVDTLDVQPEAEKVNSSLVFTWHDPLDSVGLTLQSQVSTRNHFVPVTNYVHFPVEPPPELKKYLQCTESIDCTADPIKDLAVELATGEDDLYTVVFNIAQWVQENIQYELTPETVDYARTASWVLAQRIGVCDELTSLFVALLRTLGIPTKYVSGYAYSSIGIIQSGPHAWAEVYFQDVGWVPFDMAYSEFGYIDASHIKLRESLDADAPTSHYEWRSHDTELETGPLQITTDIRSTTGAVEPHFRYKAKPYSPEVNFGSFNYIELEVSNDNPFYVAEQLHISTLQEAAAEPETQSILLAPYESRRAYWIVQVSSSLDRDYIYTLPFVIFDQRNGNITTHIRVARDFQKLSESVVTSLVKERQIPPEKHYKRLLELQCEPAHPYFYDTPTVNCLVKNMGNMPIDAEVCHEDCQAVSLSIAEQEELQFTLEGLEEGNHVVLFEAQSGPASSLSEVEIQKLGRPNISISAIAPESAGFKEMFLINFTLVKESMDSPQNVRVQLRVGQISQEWRLEELAHNTNFLFTTNGRSLHDNSATIQVDYRDREKRPYTETKTLYIQLRDANILHRIMMWLDRFFGKVEKQNN
jgi:transglutaminase-like putative cysteine protease